MYMYVHVHMCTLLEHPSSSSYVIIIYSLHLDCTAATVALYYHCRFIIIMLHVIQILFYVHYGLGLGFRYWIYVLDCGQD